MKKVFTVSLFAFILLSFASLNFAQETCFECHGEKDFSRTLESGSEQSLFVDADIIQQSVHSGLSCIDCHLDAAGEMHAEKLDKVNCENCHDGVFDSSSLDVHRTLFVEGDPDAPTCSTCHGTHNILPSDNEKSSTFSVNLPNTCGQCHQVDGKAALRHISINEPFEKFASGVHGKALAEGNSEAASCDDCHGSHAILLKSDPNSSIFRTNISKTCGKCHEDVSTVFESSIHGVALAKGEFDAPTCTSCHGEHEILSPSDPNSPTFMLNLTEQTCAPCHGLPKLNEKFGILPDIVDSYETSYHGLASIGGSKVAANCTSCHGVHNIYSQLDPRSTIHPANLKKTCGNCHVRTSDTFAKSYIHANPERFDDKLSDIIKEIYIWMIVVVIGGMLLHNFIIWLKFVCIKINKLKDEKSIQRFDKPWVIQHVSMIITFTLLVITGFALKFPDSFWVKALGTIGFNEAIRGIIHRVAAVLMLAAGFYHLYYLFFKKSWRGELKELLPVPNDAFMFIQNMRYHFCWNKAKVEKPKFKRYGYIEKAEYWALIWGTVVMAFTGFVLWFPTLATKAFPGWIIKVSETVHFYEAILAALAILLYHFFFAFFHPEDYPINLTGLTGKIPEEEAKDRYPEWIKDMEKKKNE